MPEIVITDIDGTIIDDAGQPIEPVIEFLDAYDAPIVVITNRPESERAKTLEDLKMADIEPMRLYMNKDSAPAPEYKRGVVKELMDEGFDPQAFVDNRKDVRDAVAELGVQVIDPVEIVNSAVSSEDMSKTTPEALASKLNAELSAVIAERDTLTAAASTVAAELSALKDGIATMTAERNALALKVKELEAASLSASAKAAEMVAEKAAATAQAPLKITPAENSNAKFSGKELVNAYLALNGAEQAKFFEANKADLFAARKAGIR
jgi:ribonucleotide monophosphatase NagD (HAD superfamily)